jgi:tetratricopeptide (TPR) repeat protein
MTHRFTRMAQRFGIVALVATLASGCAFLQENLYDEAFWASSPLKVNDEAELGIAQLAKGNYIQAEGHFQRALQANQRDIDALLGAGILYQNTGQFVKAREMYEAVLAIRPDESQQFIVLSDISTRPASQVASVNLSLLETGRTSEAAAFGNSPVRRDQPVGGAPISDVMLGRTSSEIASSPATQQMNAPGFATPSDIGSFGGNDQNIVSRFATMKALRDQGLITQEEYAQRRQSNIGALLPMTSPPPAAGLDRSVPTTEQITARLRAIGRALEMRAISVSQHAAERNLILDALMPGAPVRVAAPAVPPQGLLEAADSVRRLEKLQEEGFISSDEYARERQAIEIAMQAQPGAGETQQVAANTATAGAPATGAPQHAARPSGPQPGVHLASYRSERQAQSGWSQIRRAHSQLLDGLEPEISRVTLGSKGTYFRLKAGPLPSTAEANSLCRELKQRRQFCDATVIQGG